MDKQMQNLLIVVAVVGGIWYLGGGMTTQTVTDSSGVTTTDGITIETGTPTVEWYVNDAITGQDVTPAHFRVTIAGSTSEQESTDTANATRGDAYNICLMPNTTYYGVCKSGTVTKTVEKINLEAYALGSATVWINNDPENGTTRNATSAVDTLAASDTDTPTVCVQGATARASYGNGAILFAIDYNANQLDTAPTLSVGTLCPGCMPYGYTKDTNSTATVYYEVTGHLTNQDTVCGTLTVVGNSNADDCVTVACQDDPRITVYDRAYFRDSVDDSLVQAYARPTTGADTNSATNATAVRYCIN